MIIFFNVFQISIHSRHADFVLASPGKHSVCAMIAFMPVQARQEILKQVQDDGCD